MISDDFKFAWRSILRNKLIAAVNVFGLSIGISACMLIFLIAQYELAFDRFQPDRERIFRVYSQFPGPSEGVNPGVPTAVPVAIRDTFTGLESLVNFHTRSLPVKILAGSEVRDFGVCEKLIITPPDYFDVFSYYEWIIGDPAQSLSEPFKLVLTESRARTYFGNISFPEMIGREVTYQDSLMVTVSGIVKDIRERTDFDFTDFISFSTVEQSWLKDSGIQANTWNAINSSSQCFIKLAAGTDAGKIEEQVLGLPEQQKALHGKWDDWRPSPRLQRLSDLHFDARLGIFDYSRSVMDRSTLYILIGIAIFLLVIAAINFINLETARASRRAKEVGIRKVLGGSRKRIISRFLAECAILALMAVVLSGLWLNLAWIYFSDVIPQGLHFDFFQPSLWTFIVLCFAGVTLLAGFYPAVVMSSFRAASALKSASPSTLATSRSTSIRKALTVFQFAFSQVFLAATFVVVLQLDYMVNKDLGFDPEAVVFLHTPWDEDPKLRSLLKHELTEIPQIEAFGAHGLAPISNAAFMNQFEFDNGNEILKHKVYMKDGDTTYLRVYGIQLLAGRNILPVDSLHELLINETYMKLLGFNDPSDALGATIGKRHTVVGVVRDFHTESLHAGIRPTAISYDGDAAGFGIKFFLRDGHVADLQPGLARIEAAWKKVYPGHAFSPVFMNDALKRSYENEQRTSKLGMLATGIALLIACLGLFGLSSFAVLQRTREIGVRKVFGASVNSIVVLLSADFMAVVAIALVVATPVAYAVADWWLQDFAYKLDLDAWIFVLSGMISAATAFLTITLRTAKAAKADPVESLRWE